MVRPESGKGSSLIQDDSVYHKRHIDQLRRLWSFIVNRREDCWILNKDIGYVNMINETLSCCVVIIFMFCNYFL